MTEEVTPEQREEWQNTLDQWQAVNYGYPDIRASASELSYFKSCITTKPNNVRVELNNGTFTLKAGSKVYVPNGFEQDGITPHFNIVTTNVDVSELRGFNIQHHVFYDPDANLFGYFVQGLNLFSGNTAPACTVQNNCWYDTANNTFKISTNTGSSWSVVHYSLPIAVTTSDLLQCISIDQIFNYSGYFDNTIFSLPGIEGKVYGSDLKNPAYTTLTTSSVYIYSISLSGLAYDLIYSLSNNPTSTPELRIDNKTAVEYNVFAKRLCVKETSNNYIRLVLGELKYKDQKITEFNQF